MGNSVIASVYDELTFGLALVVVLNHFVKGLEKDYLR